MSEYRHLLEELVDAVTPHVNEHGADGFLLARLSDAREALKQRVTPGEAIKEAFYEGFMSAKPDGNDAEVAKWTAEADAIWAHTTAMNDAVEHGL